MTIHDGHRKRMRDRFRQEGLDGFADHEALELLLFYARARGDVNPLAHHLLEVFGSLNAVLEAGPDQLMAVDGIGEETATMLSLIVPLFRRYQEGLCAEGSYLPNYAAAEKYCKALMAGLRRERLYVISLSPTRKVVGRRVVSEGSLMEVPAYPRVVVETALNHNACCVLLCHNHPGGAALPSADDLRMTSVIEAVLDHMDIKLLDHIIVSGEEAYSMSLHGHLRGTAVKRKVVSQEGVDELEYVWQDERMLD